MILRETKNINEINTVLHHPDIKQRISSDNTPEVETPITEPYRYIVGEVDEVIGLIILHPFRDGLEVHYQVLPEYRNDYAISFAQAGIEHLKGNVLYGLVPTYHQNVIAFDKSVGFEHVDTIEGGYMKNGIEYDYYIMRLENGLSR